MRNFLLLSALLLAGCNNAARPVETGPATPAPANDKAVSVIAHSVENTSPNSSLSDPNAPRTKWSQGGTAFDTTALDAAVADASKAAAKAPNDAVKKKALATAYFKRAFELTDKRQYASALGDYRRALKLDPSNAEAKNWIEQIVQIYERMNKDAPAEGEEPPPLPFDKTK